MCICVKCVQKLPKTSFCKLETEYSKNIVFNNIFNMAYMENNNTFVLQAIANEFNPH